MWDIRKLENVLQELKPLEEQGNIEGFFTNTENADKLGGLVQSIRDATMDYQVCKQSNLSFLVPDILSRFHCNKTSINRAVNSLYVLSLHYQ